MKKKRGVAIIKVFKSIIWPRKKLIGFGLVLIILSRLSGLVIPESSRYLIDVVIANKDFNGLKMLILIVAIAVIVQASSYYLLNRLLSVESEYLIAELRSKVQKKVISLPLSYFENQNTGNIVSRIMYDAEGVKNLIGPGLVRIIGGVFTICASLILLFRINVNMTLAVLIPLVLFAIVGTKIMAHIRPIFRKKGELNALATGRLTESINGVKVIKGFNLEQEENQVFQDLVLSLFRTSKKSVIYTALLISSATLIFGITTTIIMGVGGANIINGHTTYGEFLSFTIYLGFLFTPIMKISEVGSRLTESFAGLDRIDEIMKLEQEQTTNRSINIQDISGSVSFKDVSYSYNDKNSVLKNISFEIEPGTVTALVGSSGSGKSTIASLLATFITATEGKVTIDGKDLSKVNLNSYRQHLGFVLQDDFLFDGSIKDNILCSKSNSKDNELDEAIKLGNVDEFCFDLENGLDTVVGERGVKLSGGQKQRISIARAFLANPKIVILDEATSSLDTHSELLIQNSLAELTRGRTTLVIAHRLSTIRNANQILVIDKGRIVEKGTHKELLKKKGKYQKLYTYQTRI